MKNKNVKYRCWDGNNKMMWEVTELQWAKKGGLIYIRGYFINKDGKKEGIGGFKDQMTTKRWNNLEPIQFIGQYDYTDKKHPKEIYEGAIVEFTRFRKEVLVGVVTWEEGHSAFAYELLNNEGIVFYEYIVGKGHTVQHEKIIGNKFERVKGSA